MKHQRGQVALFLLSALLAACAAPVLPPLPTPLLTAVYTPSPTPTLAPTPTITPSPTPTLVPISDVIEGASILTYGDPTDRVRQYMFTQQLQPLGINWVGLVVYCYQESPAAIEINCHRTDAPTTSDAELLERAELAHRLGLRVMLHPQQISLSGDFPVVNHGSNEEAWRLWFENYITYIVHYAQLAEKMRADLFVIGGELPVASAHDDEWRAVVAAVRQQYNGRITYAAHPWDFASVTWWDAVDVIGVDPYFPLTQSNDPTLDELKNAWVPIASQLEELSKKWNRPVLFTEVSYPSIDGANYWGGWINPFCGDLHLDLQEQADLHEALLSSFEGKPWWIGVFWWAWSGNPAEGGPYDLLGGPQGKPAEDVLRRHYGGPLRPTPTPISDILKDYDHELIVYHDTLDPRWTFSDAFTNVTTDLAYKGDKYGGQAAIRITVDGSSFEIDPLTALDLSRYDLLEFYVKFIEGTPPFISVSVGNWSPAFHEVSSLSLGSPPSPYFTPTENGWLRVRVPLSELFRAEVIQPGREITELGLVFNGYCPVPPSPYSEVLIDEIRFIGGATP